MAIKPKEVAAAQAAAGGVGLGVDAWVEGGSLEDDFDGTILEAAFTKWDYMGTTEPQLALALELRNDEKEPEEGKNPFVQYWSAGDLAHFVPSDDGKEVVPVGSKTGLSKSTNAFKLIMSMIGAPGINGGPSWDASVLAKRVDVFEGLRFHWKRHPQEERKGIKKTQAQLDKEAKFGPNTILLAETFLGTVADIGNVPVSPKTAVPAPAPALKPGAPKPPAPAAAAAPKPPVQAPGPQPQKTGGPAPARPVSAPTPPPPPTSTIDPEVAQFAMMYINEQIANNGGSHPKIGLGKNAMTWASTNQLEIPVRNKMIKALGDEAFLSTPGQGWAFDGETLIAQG